MFFLAEIIVNMQTRQSETCQVLLRFSIFFLLDVSNFKHHPSTIFFLFLAADFVTVLLHIFNATVICSRTSVESKSGTLMSFPHVKYSFTEQTNSHA